MATFNTPEPISATVDIIFGDTGDIRVEQAGSVQLETSGGKVIVDHVTGQADVSANRDIRIRQVDGGAVVKNNITIRHT